MKRFNIYTFFLLLAGIISCSEQLEEESRPEWLSEEFVAVKFTLPTTKADQKKQPVINAYDIDKFLAGEKTCVAPTYVENGVTCYNLSSTCKNVLFTTINVDQMKDFSIEMDAEGNVTFNHLTTNKGLSGEILYGKLSNITPGQVHNVPIRRYSSELKVNLNLVKLSDRLSGSMITDVKIELDNISQKIQIHPDQNFTLGENLTLSEEMYTYRPDQYESEVFHLIPTGAAPQSVTLQIIYDNRHIHRITRELDQPLAMNTAYSMNITLSDYDKLDLRTEEITSREETGTEEGWSDYINLSGRRLVGLQAGDSTVIHLYEMSPYPTTCTLIGGEEFFSMERRGQDVIIKALKTNTDEVRNATLLIDNSRQPIELEIHQAMTYKQKLTLHAKKDTRCFLTGESMIRVGATDQNPGDVLEIQLVAGETVEVEGDLISYIESHDDCIDATTCPYLEEIRLFKTSGSNLTFENYPSLKTLNISDGSQLQSITFGTNVPIREFNIDDCLQLKSLDISNLIPTLEKFTEWRNGLTSLRIYPDNYTGEQKLKYFRSESAAPISGLAGSATLEEVVLVVGSAKPGSLNFQNCPNLENLFVTVQDESTAYPLDIRGCTSLKTLRLEGRFDRIRLTGNEPIETLKLNTHINNLTLRSCPTLQRIEQGSGHEVICDTVDLFGNPNLVIDERLDFIVSKKGDFGDCPQITHLSLGEDGTWQPAYNPEINLAGCEGMTHLRLNKCRQIPSWLPGMVKLQHITLKVQGIPDLDLTNLDKVTSLKIDDYDDEALQTLIIPEQLQELHLCTLPQLNTFELSYHTSLKKFTFESSKALTHMDFTGCSGLESILFDTGDGSSHTALGEVYVSGCPSLRILNVAKTEVAELDLTDCTSLEYLNMYYTRAGADHLNRTFSTLVDRSQMEVKGRYNVTSTGGADSHDKSIPESRGWYQEY